MKPENTNPEIDPGDGAPIRCRFMARSDQPPSFREECESNATKWLAETDLMKFKRWQEANPKHIIFLRSHTGLMYVCDTHYKLIRECHD